MAVGVIFLSFSPLFWVLYPKDGGSIAAVTFGTLGVLFIAVDILM